MRSDRHLFRIGSERRAKHWGLVRWSCFVFSLESGSEHFVRRVHFLVRRDGGIGQGPFKSVLTGFTVSLAPKMICDRSRKAVCPTLVP